MKFLSFNKSVFLWSFLIACFGVLVATESLAQHTGFAVSGQGRGGPADARQAAEISQLQSANIARNTCESSGLLYSPGHSDADADGCIPPGTGATGVPTGAVLAFNLAICPDGWSTFSSANGRFIVGTGTLGSDSYSLSQTGGSARHTLSASEMPSHDHGVELIGKAAEYDWAAYGSPGGVLAANGDGSGPFLDILPAGGSQPHENRPPYVALLFCQKD